MKKNFFKVLYTDVSRAFYPLTIVISVLGCFLALMFNNSIGDFHDGFDAAYYLERALDLFYAFFLYLFAAVPYSGSFLVDHKNHYTHIFRIRSGNRHYLRSKCVAVFCSGFAVVFMGCLLYVLYLLLNVPAFTGVSYNKDTFQILLGEGHVAVYFITVLFVEALTGGTMAVLAFCFSAFVNNIYVVWCFPVVFFYLWARITDILQLPEGMSIYVLRFFPITGKAGSSVMYDCFFYLILMIVAAAICFPRMERRMSNG